MQVHTRGTEELKFCVCHQATPKLFPRRRTSTLLLSMEFRLDFLPRLRQHPYTYNAQSYIISKFCPVTKLKQFLLVSMTKYIKRLKRFLVSQTPQCLTNQKSYKLFSPDKFLTKCIYVQLRPPSSICRQKVKTHCWNNFLLKRCLQQRPCSAG